MKSIENIIEIINNIQDVIFKFFGICVPWTFIPAFPKFVFPNPVVLDEFKLKLDKLFFELLFPKNVSITTNYLENN